MTHKSVYRQVVYIYPAALEKLAANIGKKQVLGSAPAIVNGRMTNAGDLLLLT
jgi:hypothetical protein